MNTLRRINPTLLEAPGHLSEFAFDFSMSTMSINQGYMEPNLGRPCQFTVIAESELAHSVDEVAKQDAHLLLVMVQGVAEVFAPHEPDLPELCCDLYSW